MLIIIVGNILNTWKFHWGGTLPIFYPPWCRPTFIFYLPVVAILSLFILCLYVTVCFYSFTCWSGITVAAVPAEILVLLQFLTTFSFSARLARLAWATSASTFLLPLFIFEFNDYFNRVGSFSFKLLNYFISLSYYWIAMLKTVNINLPLNTY